MGGNVITAGDTCIDPNFDSCSIVCQGLCQEGQNQDPNEKVINRAKKLNNGNEVGKAKEFLLTSFVNETNGTVLDVPNKSIKHPPWDLLSKRNIEHLQRLIMKPNLLPKHLHDFQKRLRLHVMWQKEKTCIRLFVRKMRIKIAR